MWAAFADEMMKIAGTSAGFESAVQRGGGQMTPEAYAVGRSDWQKQQAIKKKLAPRKAAFMASKGRTALKAAKPGVLKRLFRLAA